MYQRFDSKAQQSRFEKAEGDVMKIGIIGTGNIGGTFARKLCAVGHQTPAALKVSACLLAKSEQKPRIYTERLLAPKHHTGDSRACDARTSR